MTNNLYFVTHHDGHISIHVTDRDSENLAQTSMDIHLGRDGLQYFLDFLLAEGIIKERVEVREMPKSYKFESAEEYIFADTANND